MSEEASKLTEEQMILNLEACDKCFFEVDNIIDADFCDDHPYLKYFDKKYGIEELQSSNICQNCEKTIKHCDCKKMLKTLEHFESCPIYKKHGHCACLLTDIKRKPDQEYYEEAVDQTMEYISEYLLSINPDFHSKYLSHVRRKIFDLKEMYPNSVEVVEDD